MTRDVQIHTKADNPKLREGEFEHSGWVEKVRLLPSPEGNLQLLIDTRSCWMNLAQVDALIDGLIGLRPILKARQEDARVELDRLKKQLQGGL